jgi:hypothetical protein
VNSLDAMPSDADKTTQWIVDYSGDSVVRVIERGRDRPLEVQATASRYRATFQSQASQSSHELGVGVVYRERG